MADLDDFIEREEGDAPAGQVQRGDNSSETTADIKARLPKTFKGLVACKVRAWGKTRANQWWVGCFSMQRVCLDWIVGHQLTVVLSKSIGIFRWLLAGIVFSHAWTCSIHCRRTPHAQGCLLLRSMHAFSEAGCDNCGWGEEQRDSGSFFDFVTPNFEGILTLLQPTKSWVVRRHASLCCHLSSRVSALVCLVYSCLLYTSPSPRDRG